MTHDFKCPKGWVCVPFIQFLTGAGDSYQFSGKPNCEYVVLERKTLNPPPEIQVGDTIRYEDRMRHIYAVEGEYIKYFEPDGSPNSWMIGAFAQHYDAAVYRNGVQIWKRDR